MSEEKCNACKDIKELEADLEDAIAGWATGIYIQNTEEKIRDKKQDCTCNRTNPKED